MSDSTLLELYFHFILIWVMVDMWVLFINNFAYRTLGMNENSSYDSLIVALVITSCSLIIIGSGISLLSSEGYNLPFININTDQHYNQAANIGTYQLVNTNKITDIKDIKDKAIPDQTKIINNIKSNQQTNTVKAEERKTKEKISIDQLFKLKSPKITSRY